MKTFLKILFFFLLVTRICFAQWVQTNCPYSGAVNCLAISDNNIFAGTYGGVFLSSNNGTSWTQVDSSLADNDVHALAISGNNIFAGTYGGVFLSTNNGASWTQENNGLTETRILSLDINGTNIFAGIEGSGVWRRPLSEMITSIGLTSAEILTRFSLEQNYPNPFNPSTKINYSISGRQLVTIKVYDILGIEIKTLVNEEKPAGTYELTFNAANLPSGVYFYRLRAGSFIETKKMVLLK